MKETLMILTLTSTLLTASAFASTRQMDPNRAGMQDAGEPAEAHGVGIVKAIDVARGTITLQHEAITSIGWPTMTMAFKVASPDLLKAAKVGDTVQFGLHPAGMASTITSIKVARP
jgi:Cu(I)/Ag(I) efflux system protein CusF